MDACCLDALCACMRVHATVHSPCSPGDVCPGRRTRIRRSSPSSSRRKGLRTVSANASVPPPQQVRAVLARAMAGAIT